MDEQTFRRNSPTLLSSIEAAEQFGVTNDYIARLCRRGKLRGVLEGRVWLVDISSLESFFGGSNTPQAGGDTRSGSEKYLSAREAAAAYRVSSDYISRLCRQKKIKGVFEGGAWLVSAASLETFFGTPIATPTQPSVQSQPASVLPRVYYVQPAAPTEGPVVTAPRKKVWPSLVAASCAILFFIGVYSLGANMPQDGQGNVASLGSIPWIKNISDLFTSIFRPKQPIVAETTPTQVTPTAPSTERLTAQTVVNNSYQTYNNSYNNTYNSYTTATGVSSDDLEVRLSQLSNGLRSEIYSVPGPPSSGGFTNTIALTQRIDNLSGVTITNATVNGLSGLTASDIPTLQYLALAGGTLTGALFNTSTEESTFAGALSIDSLAVSSTTATSTFANGINLSGGCFSVGGTCITGGGGGSGTPGGSTSEIQFNDYGALGASSSFTFSTTSSKLTVPNILLTNSTTTNATSTNSYSTYFVAEHSTTTSLFSTTGNFTNISFSNATTSAFAVLGSSTISGALNVGGTSYFGGNVGIGTTSPSASLSISGPGSGSFYGYPALLELHTQDSNPWHFVFINDEADPAYNTGLFYLDSYGAFNFATGDGAGSYEYPFYMLPRDYYAGQELGVSTDGTLGVGTYRWDTGIGNGLVMGNGTAPISSIADQIQLWAADYSAGDSRLYLKSETGDTLNFGNGSIQSSGALSLNAGGGNVGIGTTSPYAKLSLHANDGGTNTTLFAIGSSTATATTTLFTVLNSGNLGVGTTTPTQKLHVYGTVGINLIGSGTDFLTVNNTDNGQLVLDASDPHSQKMIFTPRSSTTGNNTIQTSGGIFIRNLADSAYSDIYAAGGIFSGNVGIGTTSPYSMLSVAGQVVGQNFIATSTTATSTFAGGLSAASSLYVLQNGNVGIGTTTPGIFQSTSQLLTVAGDVGVGARILFDNPNAYTGGSSGVFGLAGSSNGKQFLWYDYISASALAVLKDSSGGGYFGLGTTTPEQRLSVSVSGDYQLQLANYGTGGGAWNIGQSDSAFASGAGSLVFVPKGSASSGAVLTLKNTGNVGIGTTSPAYKFDVSGFINTDQYSGYKQAGNTILYASSTNFATLVGNGAGAALLSDGVDNTALGYQTLNVATSSDDNTALGYIALKLTTTGYANTAVGSQALWRNTTGYRNTAIGYLALARNTTAYANTVMGYGVAEGNTTGRYNTAIGDSALAANTTGYQNVVIGYNSASNLNITADDGTGYNTIIGANSGGGLVTGVNNTIIGASVSGLAAALSNNIIIADGAGNQRINVGSTGNVGIGTTSPYSMLSVAGQVVAQNFVATSTTATSTFAGGFSAASSLYVLQNGNVVVGPNKTFSIGDTATNDLTVSGSQITWRYAGSNRSWISGAGGSGSDLTLAAGSGGTGAVKIDNGGNAVLTGGPYVGTTAGTFTIRPVSIGEHGGYARAGRDLILIGGEASDNGGVTARDGGNMYLDGGAPINAGNAGNILLGTTRGKVGIGTTSPYSMLSISNSASTAVNTPLFTIASTTAGNSTTTLLTVLANGRVGVGTSFPQAALDVLGTASSSSFYASSGTSIGSSLTGTQLSIGYSSALGFGASLGYYGGWASNSKLAMSPGTVFGWLSGNGLTTIDAGFTRLSANSVGLGNGAAGNIMGTFAAERIGLGTSTPYAQLSILATSTTGVGSPTTLFAIASTTGGTATSTLFSVDNTGAATLLGNLTVASCTGCGGGADFPFTPTTDFGTAANATSTLIGFTQGLYALASSTIGGGTPITGLTISGGATTTGNAYFAGSVGVGARSPVAKMTVESTSGGISDYISLKRGSTDWRIWASDGTTGTPSLRIGGSGVTNYAWQFDWSGTTANIFKSPNSVASQTVVEIKGAASQSGAYLALSSSGGTGDILTVSSSGNVGIGTTSPFANLSVHSNNGGTNTTLFAVGSSTATATTTLFSVSNAGNVLADGNIASRGVVITNADLYFSASQSVSSYTSRITIGGGSLRILGAGGGWTQALTSISFQTPSTGFFAFSSGSNAETALDTKLARIGIGVLEINTGTSGVLGSLVAGNIGLGTSTPYAQLSILATSTTGVGSPTTLFAIASTTGGTATSTLFSVDNTGAATLLGNLTVASCTGCGGGADFPFTPLTNFGVNTSATSTALWTQAGIFASSTSYIASTTFAINGNVGIGSSTPYATLDILGASSTNPVLNLATTWNNNSVAITALKTNITDTSSNSASKLFDFQVNGASLIQFRKTNPIANTSDGVLIFGSSGGAGTNYNGINSDLGVVISGNSSNIMLVKNYSQKGSFLTSNGLYGWGDQTGTFTGAALDTGLGRSAAGVVEINNGTAGNLRDLSLRSASTTGQTVLATLGGNVGIGTTTPHSLLELNGPSLAGSSANSTIFASTTWNTTGIPTAIKLNVTDTASNASSLLMDLQKNGVSQFSISKVGVLDLGGAVGQVASIKATGSAGTINMNTGTITVAAGGTGTNYAMLGSSAGYVKVYGYQLDGSAVAEVSFDSASNLGAGKNNGGLKLVRSGTGTTEDVKALEIAETWNAAGVTFTAVKTNITDTASAAGSLIQDWQVGGASKMAITKEGNLGLGTTSPYSKLSLHANDGGTNTTLFAIGSSTATATTTLFSVSNTGDVNLGLSTGALWFANGGTRLFSSGSGALKVGNGQQTTADGSVTAGRFVTANNTLAMDDQGFAGFGLAATYKIFWSSTGAWSGTADTGLARSAAGVLEVNNGTAGNLATLISNRIGLGTSTPYAQLSILATSTTGIGSPTTLFAIASTTGGTATSTLLTVLNNGSIGMGTTSPWRTLSVTGSVAIDGLTGAIGSGSVCLTDAKELVYNSGTDNCLSSLRSTKHDIIDLSLSGTSTVAQLKPVSFIYNNDASSTVRYGFIAEDVSSIDEHLGTYNQKGELSGVDDRSMLSIVVKALQEMMQTVASFADNILTDHLTARVGDFDQVNTKMLCVGSTCVTEEQLQALLQQVNAEPLPPPPESIEEPSTGDIPIVPEAIPDAPVEVIPEVATPEPTPPPAITEPSLESEGASPIPISE